MNLNQNLLKRLMIALSVITPAAFVLRLLTYFKELDISTGFFKANGIYCAVFNGIGFAVFLLCLVLAFAKKDVSPKIKKTKKKKAPVAPALSDNEDYFPLDDPSEEEDFPLETSPEESYLALENSSREELSLFEEETEIVSDKKDPERFFTGEAKKFSMWQGTLSAFATLLPGFGFIGYALAAFTRSGDDKIFQTLFAILSLLSGIFFLVFAFRNSPAKSKFVAFFALVPTFWCTVRMVMEYRDLTRFINKSLYTGQFLFIIAAMIFFLYQAQLLFGEKALEKPNLYAFPAVAVAFFGLSARLPELLAGIGGKVSMDPTTSSSLLIDLAITFFVIIKLVGILKSDSN